MRHIYYARDVAAAAYDVNAASVNITTDAWTVIVASLPEACTAVKFINSSATPFYIAKGAEGAEVALPVIVGTGSSDVLPLNLPKGTRLTVKSIDANITSGFYSLNFFK